MLGARLTEVARHVRPDLPMADIGTDHALLPTALVQSGVVPRAIAIDNKPGPLARARTTTAGVPGLELRLGDGLTPLAAGEVGTVVLAGMGGARICALVDAWPHVGSLPRLILQPNTEWPTVRAWVAARRFDLVAETIVAERGRHYVVFVLDPNTPRDHAWDADALEFGPILFRSRPVAWRAWLAAETSRMTAAIAAADRATPEALTALTRLRDRYARVAG